MTALNGLRDASLHWLNLLSRTIRTVGVWNDSVEPCIYQGSVSKHGNVVGVVSVCVYVDDILITASNKTSEEVVVGAISSVVPTKTTGLILPSSEGGGSLTFIGRTINRRKDEVALFLSVDPQYLMPVFEDYQVKKGSNAAPDVASSLEKTDEMSLRPLSSEGYAKFRKALGKLLWLSQVRHDLKLWLSLIGSLQSKPTVGADNALKSVVRFMFNDRFVQLRLRQVVLSSVVILKASRVGCISILMPVMPPTGLITEKGFLEKLLCITMGSFARLQNSNKLCRYPVAKLSCTQFRVQHKMQWVWHVLSTGISSESGSLIKKSQ